MKRSCESRDRRCTRPVARLAVTAKPTSADATRSQVGQRNVRFASKMAKALQWLQKLVCERVSRACLNQFSLCTGLRCSQMTTLLSALIWGRLPSTVDGREVVGLCTAQRGAEKISHTSKQRLTNCILLFQGLEGLQRNWPELCSCLMQLKVTVRNQQRKHNSGKIADTLAGHADCRHAHLISLYQQANSKAPNSFKRQPPESIQWFYLHTLEVNIFRKNGWICSEQILLWACAFIWHRTGD